jgi:hypothetical protein
LITIMYFLIPLFQINYLLGILTVIVSTVTTNIIAQVTFQQNIFFYSWNQLILPQLTGKPNFSDAYFPKELFFAVGLNSITPVFILLIIVGFFIPKKQNFSHYIYIPIIIVMVSILLQRFNIARNMYETEFVNLWTRASYENIFTLLIILVLTNIYFYFYQIIRNRYSNYKSFNFDTFILVLICLFFLEKIDQKLLYLLSLVYSDFF